MDNTLIVKQVISRRLCDAQNNLYPLLKPQQEKERLAVSNCTQEVTDTATNPVNFQNKKPCADHFVLLNHLRQPMLYAHINSVLLT